MAALTVVVAFVNFPHEAESACSLSLILALPPTCKRLQVPVNILLGVLSCLEQDLPDLADRRPTTPQPTRILYITRLHDLPDLADNANQAHIAAHKDPTYNQAT